VDPERQALNLAFSDNAFDRFTHHNFGPESAEHLKQQLEQQVEKRTKLLWEIAVAKTDSPAPAPAAPIKPNQPNAEIVIEEEECRENEQMLSQTSQISTKSGDNSEDMKEKIKKAYEQSKQSKSKHLNRSPNTH
jgi:hypothetical protein